MIDMGNYIVEVRINHDGDFRYDGGMNVIFITDTIELAYEKLKERLQLLADTMVGKEYVVSEIKSQLREYVKNFNNEQVDSDGTFYDCLYFGNQDIEINIHKGSIAMSDGVMELELNQ